MSAKMSEGQYNRACDACRRHKVRCIQENSSTPKICQRCARTDRQCVYTAPQKRRQRIRTDTRVAELEKEVQAMRALFKGKEENEKKLPSTSNAKYVQEGPPLNEFIAEEDSKPGTIQASAYLPSVEDSREFCPLPAPTDRRYTMRKPLSPEDKDFIERGVISECLATQLFDTFVRDLVPHSPFVVFSPSTTAKDIRRSKPTLFLAMIAAASGKTDPSLSNTLSNEVWSSYTHRTVVNSEKSIELVQAIMVNTVWYFPPGNFAQLKFYENIHMAASMAMDLGLGTNLSIRRRRRGESKSESALSNIESMEDLEKKRTFLSCYIMSTGVAISMRRPSMLRFSRWITECVEILSSSSLAFPTDKWLCHWVKLTILSEDICSSFPFDDDCANLSEPRVQFMLKSFEKRLEAWNLEITPEIHSNVLMIAYFNINVYLHEIAMHDEHPPEDFRPPFRLDKPLALESDLGLSLTSTHIDSLAVIISSSHSMLDLLLGMKIDVLRSIPIYNYVRMGYVIIILTKLYTSTRCPSSQIGKVLDRDKLRVGFYLNALVTRLTEVVGPMECRAPYTFLRLLIRLRGWYLIQERQTEWSQPDPLDLFAETDSTVSSSDNFTVLSKAQQSIVGLSEQMSTIMSSDQVYPIDSEEQEIAGMEIVHNFSASLPAYNSQELEHVLPGQLQFSPQMNFTNPFHLFEGLGTIDGEIDDWAANIDLSEELIPGQGDIQDWNYAE